MPEILKYITGSFQGTTHAENQDGTLIIEGNDYIFCVVFDGVSMAKNPVQGVELSRYFIQNTLQSFMSGGKCDLQKLVLELNQHLISSGIPEPLTTCCFSCVNYLIDKEISISHLGDSRIYTLGRKGVNQQTTDHTLLPGSNVITKCLGMPEIGPDDCYQKILPLEDDLLLLCTDGFYHVLGDKLTAWARDLDKSNLQMVHRELTRLIEGNNYDDASYILLTL